MIVIVIPCFNEAHRLEPDPFVSFLADSEGLFFLFVNDGSTDHTAEKLEEISGQSGSASTVLNLPDNRGKAEAVREGVLWALNTQANHIGFWDGDLATPLTEIPQFITKSMDSSKKMIFGSRIQRVGAVIHRHWYRHYPGRLIALGINSILRLPVHDTQCGAKLFEAGLARQIFADPFVSSWLFDVELFARIIALHGRPQTLKIIYEVPLQRWTDVGDSKIPMSYLPKIPVELLKISWKYRNDLR